MKVLKIIKANKSFLAILLVLSLLLFYPVLKLDFTLKDWMAFDQLCYPFGTGNLLLKFPLEFYFTQYGPTYVSIEILRAIFGFNVLGFHLVSLFFRATTAFFLYLPLVWWSKKRITGYIGGLLYFVSFPGIETTIWVTHYLIYVSALLLCVVLYLWMRAMQEPTRKNLELSVIAFAIAILVGHTRLFSLPLILGVISVYYLLLNYNKRNKRGLRLRHLAAFVLSFLIIYFFTDNFREIPVFSMRINSPFYLLSYLVTGVYPTLYSFMLFMGNMVVPAQLVRQLTLSIGIEEELLITFFLLSLSLSFLSLLFYLAKRRFKLIVLSFIPLGYSISLFLSSENLTGWHPSWVGSALLGGTMFILIGIFGLYLWKNNRMLSEIILVGVLISSSLLLVSWHMFPLLESSEASPFNLESRYYTVPMVGAAMFISAFLTPFYEQLKRVVIRRSWTWKYLWALPFFVFFTLLVFLQAIPTNFYLVEVSSRFDKNVHHKLWGALSPQLEDVTDKSLMTYIYVQRDFGGVERDYFSYYLPYRFECEFGFSKPGVGPSIIFVPDRDDFLGILKNEELNGAVNIFAFRIDEDFRVSDVISEFE